MVYFPKKFGGPLSSGSISSAAPLIAVFFGEKLIYREAKRSAVLEPPPSGGLGGGLIRFHASTEGGATRRARRWIEGNRNGEKNLSVREGYIYFFLKRTGRSVTKVVPRHLRGGVAAAGNETARKLVGF